MASTATSSMVVDLSGDNDGPGAMAAAATIPAATPDSQFERSCDNPECSAPKLISLVPKRETPEFVTEPMIMNQPTLINGFTTVFQIDGIGARMNDIMYGEGSDSTSTGTSKPKSVFRIVPNTHAHIVNYVVVDGAGETMRKIKANDADTMRKLLDSQRLSAEQMLKKLIGKAFQAPSTQTQSQTQTQTQVPLPIPNKISTKFVAPAAPAPKPVSVPVPSNVLPTVPPGITITPIPLPDVTEDGGVASFSVSYPTSAAIQSYNTSPSNTSNAATKTNVAVNSKPKAGGLTPKQTTSSPDVLASKSTPSPKTTTTSSTNPLVSKATTSPATNALTPKSTTTATKSTPSPRAIASAPKSNSSPTKNVPANNHPTSTASGQMRSIQTRRLLANSRAQASSTTAGSRSILRQALATTSSDRLRGRDRSALKRRLLTAPVPEAIKRLRPRSPKPKQKTPMAVGLKWASATPPPISKKLPTLPKLPTKAPATAVQSTPPPKKQADASSLSKATPKSTPKESDPIEEDEDSKAETDKKSSSTEPKLLPVKIKPLMGPASKMNALKAMAVAKEIAATKSIATHPSADASSKLSKTLAIKPPVAKIGETVITSAKADAKAVIKTKPCSVSIPKADIPALLVSKSNESVNKEKAGSSPKPETAELSSKANTATTAKTATQSVPKANATMPLRTTLALIRVRTNLEKDPLATDEDDMTQTSKAGDTSVTKASTPKASALPSEEIPKTNTDAAPSAKSSGVSTTKSDTPSSSKTNIPPTKPTAGLTSKAEGPSLRVTRASTPKVSAASTTKTDKVSTTTPKSTLPSTKTSDTPTPTSSAAMSLRVVLPTLKSGIMTIPVRSPHPNLKISSVISGGNAVAAATRFLTPKPQTTHEARGPDIEKLQKELADLRRTVARLSKQNT